MTIIIDDRTPSEEEARALLRELNGRVPDTATVRHYSLEYAAKLAEEKK